MLVSGAWLGAWAWEQVASGLAQSGCGVTAMTLSGLSDRSDVPAEQVGQSMHVADIVSIIRDNDLRDVVLVGHSYAGIPVGQAAAQLGDRVSRVVYVDANIAHDGQSLLDAWSAAGQRSVTRQIADCGGVWPAPSADQFSGQDLSNDVIALLIERSTPQPGRSLTEPANLIRPLSEIPSTYIKCLVAGLQPTEDVQELLNEPTWELAET